jgi:CRP-like cAMP-binding protein
MPTALIAKLERFARLSADDKAALRRLAAMNVRNLAAHQDMIREGDKPVEINLMLSGWACRHKHLEDGRRQIIAFFLPGDLCDHHVFVLKEMDHSVSTITPVTVAGVSREAFEEAALKHPRITQALWWEALVAFAIQREWTVNLGQRTASERMAHLLCEIFLRLQSVGLVDGNSCDFPLTQAELGEATGLSTVHVNRTLQDLRTAGIIELKARRLTILDMSGLMQASLFNPNYLHLGHEGRHLDANE